MKEFFGKLKETFEKIPTKTRFLKDLGLTNSYVGFRYFMHGRKEEPSQKFMELVSNELEYDYMPVPVKRTEEHQALKKQLEDDYIKDMEEYLKKYNGDKARVYVKNFGQESSTINAIEAFALEQEMLDKDQIIDVVDIFAEEE